jgi:hypothetical protein
MRKHGRVAHRKAAPHIQASIEIWPSTNNQVLLGLTDEAGGKTEEGYNFRVDDNPGAQETAASRWTRQPLSGRDRPPQKRRTIHVVCGTFERLTLTRGLFTGAGPPVEHHREPWRGAFVRGDIHQKTLAVGGGLVQEGLRNGFRSALKQRLGHSGLDARV